MSRRSYQEAITKLNKLQSGYKALSERRAAPPNGQRQKANFDLVKTIANEQLDLIQRLSSLKVGHVAGTKGKGSTCMYLARLLQHMWRPSNQSIKIGLYTSPHLVSVRERIQINGSPISEELFTMYFFELWESVPIKPTYTSFLTLLAFHVFIREDVNAAVIEAVVGGEFDSTNIIPCPVVAGITPIAMDHVGTLGPGLVDIARHKAGIIKAGAPVYSVYQNESVKRVLEEATAQKEAGTLTFVDVHPSLSQITDMPLALKLNASLAYQMSLTFHMPSWSGRYGMHPETVKVITETPHPGRFQKIAKSKNLFLLDGAHTPESISLAVDWANDRHVDIALACFETEHSYQDSFHPQSYRVFVFSQTTRNMQTLLEIAHSKLSKSVDSVLFCSSLVYKDQNSIDVRNLNEDPRTIQSGYFQSTAKTIWDSFGPPEACTCATIEEALNIVNRFGQNHDRVEIFVTGSLHLVGGFVDILRDD